ncbi:hypothetical protein K439DRAFT_1412429 [Ramaria rubella]|nr:hypothetical protein K439DRAFT_1412429 [Ramaria rubella]
MTTLQGLPSLTSDIPSLPSASPSLSSISTSSDDAPQLSFEYIWDDEGNYVRLSKRPSTVEGMQHVELQTDEATGPPQGNAHTDLNSLLGNERTAENAQSIASVLSLSHSASSVPQSMPSTTPAARPFQRAVSGPIVTPGGQRTNLLTASERPIVRARRVPIEEKRKEEAEFARRDREEEEREREARRLRMREKEKENWAGGIDIYAKDHHMPAPLSSSLTRTHSDPLPPHMTNLEQSELQSHSQPLESVPYRSRRPPSKQQRVLSAVPRPVGKDSLSVRTSAGSMESRASGASVEASRACSCDVVTPTSKTTYVQPQTSLAHHDL